MVTNPSLSEENKEKQDIRSNQGLMGRDRGASLLPQLEFGTEDFAMCNRAGTNRITVNCKTGDTGDLRQLYISPERTGQKGVAIDTQRTPESCHRILPRRQPPASKCKRNQVMCFETASPDTGAFICRSVNLAVFLEL